MINCKVVESVLCTTRAGVPIKNRVCQVGDKGYDDSFSSSSLNLFSKSERNLGGLKSLHHVVLNQHDTESSMKYLKKCIDDYDSDLDIFLSSAFLLKGKIFDTQNDRFEAKRYYKKCIKLNNQTAAIDFAKQYLNEPFKG